MNRILLFIFIFSTALSLPSAAQDITGIWRGYFITDEFHQYRFEVQIEHSKNNILSGVTYSYLDKQFYGKSSMTGHFKKTDSLALIQEIKTLEVRMSPLSHTCIQKCLLTYIKSGREEFLEGTFTSMIEKTDSMRGVKRGEDCGGGTMYLRKVTTSDFYVEPFLRKRLTPDIKTPPLVKNNNQQTNKPPVTKTPNTQPKNNTSTGNRTNTNSNKTAVTVKPKTDSVKKLEITPAKPDEKNILVKPNIKIPEILKTRENSLVKTLQIKSDHVIVKLYDNGEIDDDTISVYLDNQLILSKKRLSATAITINLKMDESNPEHELVMVAENLGRIPPNTSLMIVTAGEQRYEVRITSTEQKNAMVRFRYSKPLP
jgi:hypothetical protein